MAEIKDYQGNIIDVGGKVDVNPILTSGVPIATIGGKQIFSPSISEEAIEDVKQFSEMSSATLIASRKASGYQTIAYDFKAGVTYEVYLKSANTSALVQFDGLPDVTDTNIRKYAFKIAVGERLLWCPATDFQGIRYGISGSSEVEIYSYDGLMRSGTNHVFYCGANRDIKTLKEGIEIATRYMDSVLYVDAGTYDLIEEFGDDYFANLNSGSTMSGLQLKNRIKIWFSANSKVLCHYQGSNQYVKRLFSPFNSYQYGFELINLHLECSNVRYGIHDERNGSTEQMMSWYKDCYIELDNTNNAAWSNASCIGGGLSSNSSVHIEGCYFKPISNNGKTGVYWHNANDGNNTSFASYVVIQNNYIDGGNISIQDNRNDANNDTYFIISGNKTANGIKLEISNTRDIIRMWDNESEGAADNPSANVGSSEIIKALGKTAFTWKSFDKCYISWNNDDLRSDAYLYKNLCDEYDIPYCAAASYEVVEKNTQLINGQTPVDFCKSIVANGGEIISHNGKVLTDTSTDDDYDIVFRKSKEVLESKIGCKVRGIVLAGGSGYSKVDLLKAQGYSMAYYDYSDLYGITPQYSMGRTQATMRSGETDQEFADRMIAKIDDAITNKKWLRMWCHGESETRISGLRLVFEYIKQKVAEGRIETITWSQGYDKFKWQPTI